MRCSIFAVWVLGLSLGGCSDLSPGGGGEGEIIPPQLGMPALHSYPTWADSTFIYFRNHAISYQDTSSRNDDTDFLGEGVIQYNTQTGEPQLVIPGGAFPNAAYRRNLMVCNLNRSDFILTVGIDSILLSGSGLADLRIRPSICSDGELIAYEVKTGQRESGLWVDSIGNPEESRFLGNGLYQSSWHPVAERLLYTTGAHLCEYNWTTMAIDTLFVADSFGIGYSAYSPDGTKIAFEGRAEESERRGIYILDLISRSVGNKISDHWVLGLSWGEMGIVYCNGCWDRENLECGVLWIINPATLEYSQFTTRYQFNLQ